MRISELLRSTVASESGVRLGRVHDLWLQWDSSASGSAFEITDLVVSDDSLLSKVAHGWGFSQRRTDGPWLLKVLTARAILRARVVPVDLVAHWGPDEIVIRVKPNELPPTPLKHE